MDNRPGVCPQQQWARLALVLAASAVILYLIVAAWVVLAPFFIGLILAWIVLPAVDWLEARLAQPLHHRGIARFLAILVVYAVALALLAALLTWFLPIVFREALMLFARREELFNALASNLSGLRRWYESNIPLQVRMFIEQQFPTTAEQWLELFERDVLLNLLTTLRSSWPVLAGYIIVPFWLIYFIYDAGWFRRAWVHAFPEGIRPDVINVSRIVNAVAGAFLRGQLVVALTIGFLTGLGLFLLGVPYAATLGVITAIGGLIPTFGPIIAAIPAVIIAALVRPVLALWTLLIIVGVRELEELLLGPRILGTAVRVRPALVIVLLLVAGHLWGFLGLLLAVPVAAALRDVYNYLYLRTSPRAISPGEALEQISRSWHRPTGRR